MCEIATDIHSCSASHRRNNVCCVCPHLTAAYASVFTNGSPEHSKSTQGLSTHVSGEMRMLGCTVDVFSCPTEVYQFDYNLPNHKGVNFDNSAAFWTICSIANTRDECGQIRPCGKVSVMSFNIYLRLCIVIGSDDA